MRFSCISKFQINVWVIICLNCTFKDSLNGIASCNGQNDIHNKLYKSILYKKYMNLIKHNLELIALIKILFNKLFLDSKQSNLNFDHSFGGIYKVLREIRLFEDE